MLTTIWRRYSGQIGLGALLGLFSAMVPVALSIAAPDAGQSKVPLQACVKRSGDDLVVMISIRNTKDTAVRIDRDMVFYVHVWVEDKDHEPIEWVDVKDAPTPTTTALRDRLVVLQPGMSYSRECNLSQGLKRLHVASGIDAAFRKPLFFYGESIVRMPVGATVRWIRVSYGQNKDRLYKGAILGLMRNAPPGPPLLDDDLGCITLEVPPAVRQK